MHHSSCGCSTNTERLPYDPHLVLMQMHLRGKRHKAALAARRWSHPGAAVPGISVRMPAASTSPAAPTTLAQALSPEAGMPTATRLPGLGTQRYMRLSYSRSCFDQTIDSRSTCTGTAGVSEQPAAGGNGSACAVFAASEDAPAVLPPRPNAQAMSLPVRTTVKAFGTTADCISGASSYNEGTHVL